MKKNLPKESKKSLVTRALPFVSLLISVISLYLTFLVRSDTLEMSKFADKPLYYSIKLYPEDYLKDAEVHDKYVTMDIRFIVDDFKLKNKNILNLNYNALLTKIKYFMVYDYSLKDKTYSYMRYTLDDKTQAKYLYDDQYEIFPTQLNYSLTPNKKYCYILVYTESNDKKNLDLVFFRYYDEGDTFSLDTITDNDKTLIDTMIINNDTIICKDYFIDLWSNNDEALIADIEFMYNVYDDLFTKLNNHL